MTFDSFIAKPPRERDGEKFRDDLVSFVTPGTQHNFFGYYDKSPIDLQNRFLLCHQTTCDTPLPETDDFATVGMWSLENGAFIPFGKTNTFNWQQGSMLQWLGPGYDQRVIYNDRRNDRFISVIHDIETGEDIELPAPIYTLDPGGSFALTVDFERLYYPRRNYAYAGIERPAKNQCLVKGDGIFRLDLRTGAHTSIITTEQMCSIKPMQSMHHGDTYLEHLMMNPTGTRFMFLHRWNLPDGGVYTRLCTAGPQGETIRILLDSGNATHACWRGDDEIVVWGALPSKVRNMRRKPHLSRFVFRPLLSLYRSLRPEFAKGLSGASYLLVKDSETPGINRFASQQFTADGHPSWNPVDSNWMLTDTYQDSRDLRWFSLYDAEREQRHDLGKIYSPPAFNSPPNNCDLHPRWNFTGDKVCIDTTRDDVRKIYVFDVETIINDWTS